MEGSEKSYEVVITKQGELGFRGVWDYLVNTHTLEQAERKIDELYSLAMSLGYLPERGGLEDYLNKSGKEYRFLVYSFTQRKTVKIIYRIEEEMVLITDFFPCQMSTEKLVERNKED